MFQPCIVVGLLFVALLAARPADAETIVEQQAATEREYAAQLKALARRCDEKKLPEQAAATRKWIVPQAPLTLVVPLADERLPEAGDEASQAVREWAERFRRLRQAQGKQWFELAQRAAKERQFAMAFQRVHATLREDPDHQAARRLLGYKRQQGRWLSPYESNKAQAHQVWHERFGWLPEKQVARYESGERFFKGRWITADEDERLHAEIGRGWDVVTEHYQVRTDHSLEEGVRLASRLEEFYGVWRQLFVRYVVPDEQLARLFREGAPANRVHRRHQVTYFRNREEYMRALGKEHPAIGITTGYYAGPQRTAYFFVGDEEDDSTVYHEATHQLFSELKQVSQVGRDANFWVVEGIACFMESYKPGNRLVTLGGADALRLDNARTWLLEKGQYLPLAELCALGMDDLQGHAEIKMIYSEASGMTYYLLFAGEGRYRQSLVDYLSAVYANRDRPQTLAELTGTSFSKHDEQYHQFLKHLP
ncbi:MAG TPA: DUF1570 domain-containing protein [Pirellulales bacterium]|nr:DUF1570 domain-containing protein [Pirellulales bacterium]